MNKTLPATILLGITVILVWSINAYNLDTVFAQTPDDSNAGPVPEGNYTDPNTGPIPEDDTNTSPDNSNDTSTIPDDMSSNMPSSDPLSNDTTTDNMTGLQDNAYQPTLVQTNAANAYSNLAPLEQVKSGVIPKDVQCKNDFTLIIKADDGSPACVKPDVVQILIQRGW